MHAPPKHPRDIWTQVTDSPPPSSPVHPATAPTHPPQRPTRQLPRTQDPTPELTATQKWWAALMDNLWATALSPESGPWGRAQSKPAKPALKPRRPTPPSIFRRNKGTKNGTRAECATYNQHSARPAQPILSCGVTVVMFDILRNIYLLTTLLLSIYI